tara:strand:+ start:405 stop:1004 length:600 start_codon:yes stop_codon:yes gene_type:complete
MEENTSFSNKIENMSKTPRQNLSTLKTKLSSEIYKDLNTLEEKTGIDWFKIIRYILFAIVIFVVSINILYAFHLLPQHLINLFYRLLFITRTIENTTKQTVNTTLKGAQVVEDKVETVIDKIKEDVEEKKNIRYNNIPVPNDSLENNKFIGRSNEILGYCYVGTDRGYRSCIDIEDRDKCMSGEIFPTKAICINPNLRQ